MDSPTSSSTAQKRFTLVGPERQGALADVLALLGASAQIVAIDQVALQGQGIFALTFSAPGDAHALAAVAEKAKEWGLEFDSEAEAPSVSSEWALTLMGPRVTASALAAVLTRAEAQGLATVRIAQLGQGSIHALEVTLRGESGEPLRAELAALESEYGLDLAIQRDGWPRRAKRLLVMDMDSTLIQHEVIDELAREVGAYDAVAEVTRRAMNGEMDFNTALRERCRRLAGADASVFETVRKRVQLTEGAPALVRTLKRLGYRIAVVSGGFIQVVEPFRAELGLDYAYANELEVKDGKLTGELVGPIVNRERKAELLVEMAAHNGIPLELTMAIGDGANDLDMLGRAGIGIAFNAKPAVQAQVHFNIRQPRLDAALYFLGIADSDFSQ